MNTFTKTAFTLAVAVLAAQGLYAQTKLTMPQKKAKPDKAAVESPQKATADAAKAKAAQEFTSPWPVYSAHDKAVFGQYVSEEGKKPQTVLTAPQRSPYGPEDDTEYTYIGFNQAAGLADDVAPTIDNIVHERRLEFVGEGKRYWDLVRTGKAASTLVPDKYGYRTNSWTGSKKYLPIPQSEIDAAQGTLTQNNY